MRQHLATQLHRESRSLDQKLDPRLRGDDRNIYDVLFAAL